ncbi:hypothetical protein CALVIDRAFT_268604 [Calocera viscosa TUFC12733]|uniref:Uncharacterized protein n=1 Tax=Calocera viscosa (strain TUFC12733) TaxID=1330018 RepID=A0A167J0H3_CALVF|nr:hypothetical protein CALVIDRAFT_268604 [Calocera viscosa TUFC12733]
MVRNSFVGRSLYGCSMLVKQVSELDGSDRIFGNIKEEFKICVSDFVASSISIPVEFLCVCRFLWEPSWSRVTAEGRPLSSMEDFFWPLIDSKEHSSLSKASMKLLTTQVEKGMLASRDISKTLKCLLRWFRDNDHLYPKKQLALANSGLREVELPHEKNLLRACVNWHVNRGFAIPCEVVDLAQLLDVESTRIRVIWIKTHLSDLQLFFRQLENLGHVAQAFNQQRVWLWASHILYCLLWPFNSIAYEERILFTPVVKSWLACMCIPGILEMHLERSKLRSEFHSILRGCLILDVLLLRESRVMQKLQVLYEADETISWSVGETGKFKALLGDYKARLENLSPGVLVQRGTSAEAETAVPTEGALLPHTSGGWFQGIVPRLNPLPLLSCFLRCHGGNGAMVPAGRRDVEMALVGPSQRNAGEGGHSAPP